MSVSPPTYASASWDAHKQKRFRDLQYDTVIATGTREQRAQLLLQLESEHNAILALAKDVLTSRNACVPISALPLAIFVRIVDFVAQDDRPSWEILGRKFRVSSKWRCGWIDITRVCKRWRSACLGATELWRYSEAPDPYFSAGSMGSETARTRMIPVPTIFPALRELHLSRLRLSHAETLNLISRLPILEVLEIHDCAFGDTVARPESDTVELPHLKQLMLVDLCSATVTDHELGTHAPFFRMHESLHYPRSAAVKLAPKLMANWGTRVDAREISILRTLVIKVLDIIGLPSSWMCVHLGLSGYRDEAGSGSDCICFRAVPAFGEITSPLKNRSFKGSSDFWRMCVGTGELQMSSVFNDPVMSDILGNMAMLSMSDTSIFHLNKSNPAIPALLSHAFHGIRILRVSIESSEYEASVWHLLSQLLSPDATGGALRLPHIEELWFGPYSCLRKDIPSAIKRISKRLRDRSRYIANKIHTIRVDIVRPEAQNAGGEDASALESLFSTVIWADA
ncbi:hypothetical protein PENSPDRAFT_653896 [Peniophora sp. CONT]|nr:hypothetical protein PENSPDRAFT_653896 [Peniophora sp. CONT]